MCIDIKRCLKHGNGCKKEKGYRIDYTWKSACVQGLARQLHSCVTLGHRSTSLSQRGHRWAEGLGVMPVPRPTSQGCCEGDGLTGAETLY